MVFASYSNGEHKVQTVAEDLRNFSALSVLFDGETRFSSPAAAVAVLTMGDLYFSILYICMESFSVSG